jgi:uncharacterized membrane protein
VVAVAKEADMTDTTEASNVPEIRDIGFDDVTASLKAGLRDFGRVPVFGLFLGGIFSVIGIVIFLQLIVWGSSYWVLPIAVGFPLLGPFLAIGLYEVSRKLQEGEPMDWAAVLSIVVREKARQIPSMVFVSLFFYLVWVYLAHLIFALSFGLKPLTNVMTSLDILLTTEGIIMLVAGTLVGGALAFLLFAVSVVSIPMILDREIDAVTAMITSVRAVLRNKGPMLAWGMIIAASTLVAMVPLFLGMLIVFPVLGHASWHLYKRAVVPADG